MGKTGLEVFGLYTTATGAEIALDRLLAAGYTRGAASLLMVDAYRTRDAMLEKNTRARCGATTSIMIGGTLGSLNEIRSVAIRGIGPVISAGCMMSRLNTDNADTITNAITSMGVPELEARHYEDRVKDGDVLLALHCESQAETHWVKRILKESGGEEVAGWAETAAPWRTMKKEPYTGAPRPEMHPH